MRKRPLSQRSPLVLFDRDDMHWNMNRSGVVLQPIQNRPAIAIGQPNVQRDRRRIVFVRQRQGHFSGGGDQALESLLARGLQKDVGKVEIILDD